jgi:hypothetical protein
MPGFDRVDGRRVRRAEVAEAASAFALGRPGGLGVSLSYALGIAVRHVDGDT